MITYREELEKLDSYIENNKLKHSILSIIIYKFLFWIKIKLKKKDGYIDFMSKGKDSTIIIDMLQVLYNVIIDVKEQIELEKDAMLKFNNLEEVLYLLLNNLDSIIRLDPHIIYDEDEDEELSIKLDGNLINKLESLLSIDNYLEENIS